MAILLITAFTDWRLIDSNLFAHLFDFGTEGLNSVQAWVNHGFWSMVGFFPWGKGYFPANVEPDHIYQSKTPLHLFPLWGGYLLFGSPGFPIVKTIYSLGLVSINGLLLGGIARLCFPLRGANGQSPIPGSLVFVCTYAIAISNEALLRFCMIDEPDYLGLTVWLATVLALGLWAGESGDGIDRGRPRFAMVLGFMTSWIYPILGVMNVISLFLLQLFPISLYLRRGLRSLIPGGLAGIGLYWIQRVAANLLIPQKLFGSKLIDRVGLTSDMVQQDGVLDAFDFIFDQRSGGIPEQLRKSQLYDEHSAIWIIGLLLFVVLLARLPGMQRKVILVLAAGQSWLLIPLLSQSVSQHGWVYAIHFMPSVVLGWIGALTTQFPGHRTPLFAPGMLGFFALLIWVIQLRWFLVAYLG
ncbi:MAG: hypothetical protein VKP70_01020 [Cyanobacteriota bacterium]|nr:hypothetical protein [Cyanobacteriota bacterium]